MRPHAVNSPVYLALQARPAECGGGGPVPLSSPLSSPGRLLYKYTLNIYNNILITLVSTKKLVADTFATLPPSPLSCRPRQRHIKAKQCHSSATILSTRKCLFAISSMTTETQKLFIVLRRRCDLVHTMAPVWWSRRSWR